VLTIEDLTDVSRWPTVDPSLPYREANEEALIAGLTHASMAQFAGEHYLPEMLRLYHQAMADGYRHAMHVHQFSVPPKDRGFLYSQRKDAQDAVLAFERAAELCPSRALHMRPVAIRLAYAYHIIALRVQALIDDGGAS
jgi:hypothetical protein